MTNDRQTNASVIVLEFNELCPDLMERFMAQGELPNFQRLRRESHVFTTDAEEKPPVLNPWVQWVTVHSGLPFAKHGVFYLSDGHKLKEKCVWDLMSDDGRPVWVCGSMNVRYDRPITGAVLPDPWSSGVEPSPAELLPYYRFVQRRVQEHTNVQGATRLAEYTGFLSFMLAHGLSLSTLGSVIRELARERVTNYHWRRTVLLDRLQWDLFKWYYTRITPALSTFFLNSTAHFQHKYWRNMEPEQFKIKPSEKEQKECGRAVLYGYQQMDRIVGEALSLIDERTSLILCTALSQQPCLEYEDEGGKCFYRPRKFEELLVFAGVRGAYAISPVMSEEFNVYFDDEETAAAAAEKLESLRVGGRAALWVRREGSSVYSGCSIYDQLPAQAVLQRSGASEGARPFFELFYQGEGIKSGIHHPDGMLWIRRPDRTHRVRPGKVSLCDVAPTLLSLLGIPPPATMSGEDLLS